MNAPSIPLFQVDAFTGHPFRGNPAAVCMPETELPDSLMLSIAAEMNLSETAFLLPAGDSAYSLRWFTPQTEVALCGHATLAAAAVLFAGRHADADALTFHTKSGPLAARRRDGGIALDFPLNPPQSIPAPTAVLAAAGLSNRMTAAYSPATRKLLVEVPDFTALQALEPDFPALRQAGAEVEIRGLIVTTRGAAPFDFSSRYFAPWVGVNEDPVTGSAHTVLAPYWATRLEKREMHAHQASPRGGELHVRLTAENRVELLGRAVIVVEGKLFVSLPPQN